VRLNQPDLATPLPLSSVDAFVLDCDGVLLDTVAAKLRAFQNWVPPDFAHLRAAFDAYSRRAFGINRFEQIRYFFERLAEVPVTDGRVKDEAVRFGKLVASESTNATWLPGSKEFVERMHEQKIPLYVLSGTPEEELKENLRQQGTHFFLRMIGAPRSKEEGLRWILNEGHYKPEKTWFIGDADRDYFAAHNAGVRFIYKRSEVIVSEIKPDRVVQELTELL
jgi:HAD superfamily hydrolase (TIGR01549 family)